MTVQFTNLTKFLVGILDLGTRIPTAHTLNNTAVASAGASSLTVTATTGYLAGGRKLTIGGVQITIAQDTPRGSTTVPIVPLTTGQSIASGANVTYYELVEFIGGESLNVTANDQVINIRNFKSGQWNEQARVMTGLTVELEGQFHIEDLAITAVIRPASFVLGKEVYSEITRNNGDKWSGAFLVQGYSEPASLDNVVRVRFTLASQGAIGIPAAASLAIA